MTLSVHVAGTGFTVLDRVYASEEPPFQTLGGSCGNVLVSLAMLERSVAPVLTLGEDSIGDDLVSEFTEAGAHTTYIFQRKGVASPVLAQTLDTSSGEHTFSFVCPETAEAFPRYRPIAPQDAHAAEPVLRSCQVFYADRVSAGILQAMETAAEGGAIVYFEPSRVDHAELFERAIALATIVKCSADRLDLLSYNARFRPETIAIVTHGGEGLEVSQRGRKVHCPPIAAAMVRDTSGSGDMVSIGLIDWILKNLYRLESLGLDEILDGVHAGQRLAAANCAFSGARGLFKSHGGQVARRVLDDARFRLELQMDLFSDGTYSAA